VTAVHRAGQTSGRDATSHLATVVRPTDGGRRRDRQRGSTAPPPLGGKCPTAAILEAHPGCAEVAPSGGGAARTGVAARVWHPRVAKGGGDTE
jgi:hypothetical protein